MKAGGKLLPLENRQNPVPQSLVRWSNLRRAKVTEEVDFTNIQEEMAAWWRGFKIDKDNLDPNRFMKEDWCGGGLAGISLFLIGMKEWGLENRKDDSWVTIVDEMTQLFKTIPLADALYVIIQFFDLTMS
jgi:hypothetical protein